MSCLRQGECLLAVLALAVNWHCLHRPGCCVSACEGIKCSPVFTALHFALHWQHDALSLPPQALELWLLLHTIPAKPTRL